MAMGSDIRVGDADREAVAGQLRDHYADGRLTIDELNERLDQAFAARTRADLNAVMRDLPVAGRPAAGTPVADGRVNAWQDAAGSGSGSWQGSSGYSRASRSVFAAVLPLLAVFWVFIVLGSLFAFGLGGNRPLAIVFFLGALAFLRRLFGVRRRGFPGPGFPRGRRCGRPW